MIALTTGTVYAGWVWRSTIPGQVRIASRNRLHRSHTLVTLLEKCRQLFAWRRLSGAGKGVTVIDDRCVVQRRWGLNMSNRKLMKPASVIAGATFVVASLLSGCSPAESSGGSDEGSDSSNQDDSSRREQTDPNAGIPDPDGTDFDSLKAFPVGHNLDQLDIDYSGTPSDIYVVLVADGEADSRVTVESVDESGERETRDFEDLTDPLTVLTPDQTGLKLEEGRTGVGPDPTEKEGACKNEYQAVSGLSTGPSECPYVIDYVSAAGAPLDAVSLLVTDGTGRVLANKSVEKVHQQEYLINDGTNEFVPGGEDN